jgi:hypothetical protein
VSDNHGRPTLHDPFQTTLYDALGPRVDARRGLVQDQDQRIVEHRSSESQQLLLTLAQVATPFPHRMVVAVGEVLDEGVGSRDLRSLHDLFAMLPENRNGSCGTKAM